MSAILKDHFKRINNDVNGNPRYVIHFTLCYPPQWAGEAATAYDRTVKLMNKIGGRRFHNKQYGGGIVFQSYNLNETIKAIETTKKNV